MPVILLSMQRVEIGGETRQEQCGETVVRRV